MAREGHALLSAVLVAIVSALASGCVPRDHGWAAPYRPDQSPKIPVTMPAGARSISQEFRYNLNINGHEGIDVIGPVGTPVIAAADGTVTKSFFEPMYGNRIVIDHGPDASGRRMVTIYKHLKQRIGAPGTHVSRGQTIASLGNSGALAGGIPHLHFEVHREASAGSGALTPIDPHLVWANGPGKVTCFDAGTEQPPSSALSYPVACR